MVVCQPDVGTVLDVSPVWLPVGPLQRVYGALASLEVDPPVVLQLVPELGERGELVADDVGVGLGLGSLQFTIQYNTI